MENYNEFVMNGNKFSVKYEIENNIIWAITYINGKQIKKSSDSRETAYWSLQQSVYQELNIEL